VTSGLIIGKFMPPHAGHQYLIDYAGRRVTHLHLVLFTKTAEPIPGHLRAAWLRELYPSAHVHHLHLDHAVDYGDPAAWDFWVQAIRSVVPAGPDLVFSSEAYGSELARRLGAQHESVDPARAHVPISATQIRQQPLAHWDSLPAPVRPYFVCRVCVLGAESTGKTTLAAALADESRQSRHRPVVRPPDRPTDCLWCK
jgi:NadR type nicotinamide-nucleotide adenylyltransferase